MAFQTDSSSPILKPLPGIVRSIGASQRMLVDFPVGATFSAVSLYCTIAGSPATRAQIEAMLVNWRLTISGIEKFNLTGVELLAGIETEQSGLIADTGVVTIPFQRLFMSEDAGRFGPNYGTLGESSFRLEIDQAAGTTIDAVVAYAEIQPQAEPLGVHMLWRKFNVQAGAGVNTFTNFPIFPGSGEHLYKLDFECPTIANLTNVAIIADNARIIDIPPTVGTQWYKMSTPARVMQTAKNIWSLCFDARNRDADGLPMTMNSIQIEATFSANPTSYNLIAKLSSGFPPAPVAAK